MSEKNRIRTIKWGLCFACLLLGFVLGGAGYWEKSHLHMGLRSGQPPEEALTMLPEGFSLTLNERPLPQNEEGVYYIPQSIKHDEWQCTVGCTVSGAKLVWQEDEAWHDKLNVIRDGHIFTLWVFRDEGCCPVQVQFTGLPLMTLQSQGVSQQQEQDGSVTELYSGNMVLFDPDGENGYTIEESRLTYHVRGAKSAAAYEKVGYKLNLKKADGVSDKNLSLLGMAADDDWILRCLYTDPTKTREQVAVKLWNELADTNPQNPVGSNSEYIELAIDGQYYGLMGLMQRTDAKLLSLEEEDILYKNTAGNLGFDWQNHAGRDALYDIDLPIAKENGNISLGSLSLQNPSAVNPSDVSSAGTHKVRIIAAPQDSLDTGRAWQPLTQLWEDIYNEEAEPISLAQLESRYAVDNLIDFALYKQLCYAVDNEINNMFYLARWEENGYRLYYIPWDLDYTFGNVGSSVNKHYSRFNPDSSQVLADNLLLETLMAADEDAMIDRVQQRWAELREDVFSNEKLTASFEENRDLLTASGALYRDAQRWPGEENTDSVDEVITYLCVRTNFVDSYINGLGMEW